MYPISTSRFSGLSVFFVFLLAILSFSTRLFGQSTFGSVVGTVSDPSGALVKGATATLVNTGTSTQRTAVTDENGSYSFNNLDAGKYSLTVGAQGFEKISFTNIDLLARETRRVDATLKVGTQNETVNVEGTSTGVITTDASNLTITRTGDELIDLPVAIYSRSNGSTSPISTLTTQSGVQTDNSGNLIIAGTTPALMSVTLDGISTMNIEYAAPLTEMFPSFNSIAEMKVSQVNANAEFSGVSDITTTSKSGTNRFHGGVFENHENRALASGDPFALNKPKLIMNDFGGYVGGPIIHNKTFFFASYEGLRLPRETPIVTSVPSVAMRAGNLCSYLAGQGISQVFQPDGTTPIPCAAVPIDPVSANFMKYLLPLPNTGPADSYSNNYSQNMPTPISSNQFDVRVDQNIASRQTIFGRVTYKKRSVTTAPNPYCPGLCELAGSPSTGSFSQPETDLGLTFAHNFVIRPNLMNEARGGWSHFHLSTTLNVNSANILSEVGIVGLSNPDPHGAVPSVVFGNGFQQTGGANPSTQIANTFQLTDNLTWTKGKHTVKFGADFRRLSDHDDNPFGSWRSGAYEFLGPGASAVGTAIGDSFTSFLLGYPDFVLLTLINDDQMNGLGYSWGFYAQDDWKVTPSLTINLGLRYELHPPLHDTGYNTGAFLPDYEATIGGVPVHGAIVVPNQKALAMTDQGFAGSIAPTPILTASQAGIPSALRFTYKKDFGPRIGFAWRPFHNDKTVVRGGYGRFIMAPLGFNLLSGWATTTSYIPFYGQYYSSPGVPALRFPSPFYHPLDFPEPGTASFYYAFPIHFIDPSVQQWNLTFERELGFNTGLRISYVGNHGSNLQDMVDLNQVPANTVGYGVAGGNRPYPIWGIIESVANGARSNYNALNATAQKRFSNGLQFEASYVFTRDLSDAGGANPTAIPTEPPQFVTDRFHPNRDYGNVIYDRRHRFVMTYLYALPFGKGKTVLGNASGIVNGLVNGWEWGGVLTFESGPFLTPYQTVNDSAGTNIFSTVGSDRADIVPGVSMYSHGTVGKYPLFLNAAAFAIPGGAANNPIGRFGDAAVGSVVGPGTSIVAMSLLKNIPLKESVNLQFGISASNLFNHKNYQPPNMQVGTSGFGQISALQTAEGAGPRIVELTGRITF